MADMSVPHRMVEPCEAVLPVPEDEAAVGVLAPSRPAGRARAGMPGVRSAQVPRVVPQEPGSASSLLPFLLHKNSRGAPPLSPALVPSQQGEREGPRSRVHTSTSGSRTGTRVFRDPAGSATECRGPRHPGADQSALGLLRRQVLGLWRSCRHHRPCDSAGPRRLQLASESPPRVFRLQLQQARSHTTGAS